MHSYLTQQDGLSPRLKGLPGEGGGGLHAMWKKSLFGCLCCHGGTVLSDMQTVQCEVCRCIFWVSAVHNADPTSIACDQVCH